MNTFENYKESPVAAKFCRDKKIRRKKMRWHVLYELIVENNYKKCLEIGTAEGATAHSILSNVRDVTWTSIDPYASYKEYTDGHSRQATLTSLRKQAYKNLSVFGDRWSHIEKVSSKAAHEVADDYDLIFIDGNHAPEFVSEDIKLFYPKVRPGGALSGHDYGSGRHKHVKKVVDGFARRAQLNVFKGDNMVWFVIKPG